MANKESITNKEAKIYYSKNLLLTRNLRKKSVHSSIRFFLKNELINGVSKKKNLFMDCQQ